jgi:DNA-binding response OmpR family regulator
MRVLIVEDERRMAEVLRRGLSEEGHAVEVAGTGPDGLEMALSAGFDVIILDVMLPGLGGLDVARRLREGRVRTPILMLTARDANTDVVAGLDAGADDYLVKPFSFDVLLARVRALARRGPTERGLMMTVGDLRLDAAAHEVWRGPVRIELTRTEFSLLECLLRRRGAVVTRNAIIEGVWGRDHEVEDNTLDAFVRLLRQKTEAGGRPRLIQTVRGLGYALREEPVP